MVSSFCPDKGFRLMVSDLKVVVDRRLQFPGAAMDTTTKLLLGEGSEPPLYEVKPG